eukprot:11114555-Alexandrium_andersonii.AAC.1
MHTSRNGQRTHVKRYAISVSRYTQVLYGAQWTHAHTHAHIHCATGRQLSYGVNTYKPKPARATGENALMAQRAAAPAVFLWTDS